MDKKQNTVKGEAAPKVESTTEVKEVSQLPKPEEIKKNLEEQIKKFDRLNRLVNNRSLFNLKKEQLNNYLNQMQTEIQGSDLETKICKLTLSDPSNYSRSEGLTISNALVIEKAIRFILAEIEEKVKHIETEILTIN
jgi:hypothetical protein